MINNFNILRVLFSVIVLLYHIGVLSNIKWLLFFPGTLSVHCFFVISGYLITKSFFENKNIKVYFYSRILRIYPLYIIVILASFFIGSVITTLTYDDYINSGAIKYVISNLLLLNFLEPNLPGVFIDNGNGGAVNGSLWTIKVEVMFYLIVPVIYSFFIKESHRKIGTIIIGVSSIIFCYYLSYLIDEYNLNSSLNNQLPSFLSYFMVGAYFNFIKKDNKHILLLLPFVIYGLIYIDWIWMKPILTGFLVYILAFLMPKINVSEKLGDISYGIYIWHFPVIQLYIYYGLYSKPILGVSLTLLTVLMLSYISWHLIEKKCVNHSKQYRYLSSKADVIN